MRDENFVPERILDALQRHQVEYLMVGGMAALAYGAERPKDHEALPELHQLHERQGGPVRGRWTEPPYQRPSHRSGRHDDPGRDLDR